MTEYTILKHKEGNLWLEYHEGLEASSAERAIRAAATEDGLYVALPYRSWKPLTVKTEQTTKVTVTAA